MDATPAEIVTDDELGEDRIRLKRVMSLIGVWRLIQESKFNPKGFFMSVPLINDLVEHYVSDVRVIKTRARIPDLIELHKVSGLICAGVMRFRPLVPSHSLKEFENEHQVYANELFGVIHGMAVCFEFEDNGEIEEIWNEDWFEPWFRDMRYLLRYRNYTPDSLIAIFQTMRSLRFRESALPKQQPV